MAHKSSILRRLQAVKEQQGDTSEAKNVSQDIINEFYAEVIAEVKAKADEEAAAKLAIPLEQAKSDAVAAFAQLDAERTVHAAAKVQIQELERALSSVQSSLASAKEGLRLKTVEHMEINEKATKATQTAERKSLRLESEITSLKGRLTQAEQTLKTKFSSPQKPTVQQAIPSFSVKPAQRDTDGRIIEAIITPRLN